MKINLVTWSVIDLILTRFEVARSLLGPYETQPTTAVKRSLISHFVLFLDYPEVTQDDPNAVKNFQIQLQKPDQDQRRLLKIS